MVSNGENIRDVKNDCSSFIRKYATKRIDENWRGNILRSPLWVFTQWLDSYNIEILIRIGSRTRRFEIYPWEIERNISVSFFSSFAFFFLIRVNSFSLSRSLQLLLHLVSKGKAKKKRIREWLVHREKFRWNRVDHLGLSLRSQV